MSLPRFALTLGDPAGIGPEIVARTLYEGLEPQFGSALAIGDASVLERAVRVCGLDAEVRRLGRPSDSRGHQNGVIEVFDCGGLDGKLPTWGEVSAMAGAAAIAAIETAVAAALSGEISAVVTAPINKEAIWQAGCKHLGHTELLAELTGSNWTDTMFLMRRTRSIDHHLKLFFTTRHVSLRQAIDQISESSVYGAIMSADRAMKAFGTPAPRLAVAALNPHAGENGAFGREELEHIGPACAAASAQGIDVVGPIPADSVFAQGLTGRYDGVLTQFHDQGHVAAKTFDFDGTVSVTLGLPILRTSVDHGTAFDIAGQGRANHATMRSALSAAVEYVGRVPTLRAEYGRNDGLS